MRYAVGDWSFDECQDWLIDAMRPIEESGEPEAAALANRIEKHLAKFTSGYIDEEHVTDALRPLVPEAALVPVATGS